MALIEALFDEADKHNLLRLQSLSYAVWDEICRLAPKPENTVSESSRLSAVKNMMHAIHSGYAEKLTLEEIARARGMYAKARAKSCFTRI